MIAKKSKKADLEGKRFAFFQIGLVVAGAATLLAFEYTTVQVEQKKVTQVMDKPVLWMEPLEDIEDEQIFESRPQPTQTSLQMQPIDEVIIAKNPVVGTFVSKIIVIDEPCIDCQEKLVIVDDFDPRKIYEGVDIEPSYPGGDEAMNNFLRNNVVFPTICREMNLSGMVYVHFVVNTDGSICQVHSDGKVHEAFIQEAERVVKSMPNWIPGEQAGKKVRVRFTIPINFVTK